MDEGYNVKVKCYNCKHEDVWDIPKGMLVEERIQDVVCKGFVCPVCGTSSELGPV